MHSHDSDASYFSSGESDGSPKKPAKYADLKYTDPLGYVAPRVEDADTIHNWQLDSLPRGVITMLKAVYKLEGLSGLLKGTTLLF